MVRARLQTPRWTTEDVQQLRELAATGASARAIARVLRRTVRAVETKARNEGIALAGSKDG